MKTRISLDRLNNSVAKFEMRFSVSNCKMLQDSNGSKGSLVPAGEGLGEVDRLSYLSNLIRFLYIG